MKSSKWRRRDVLTMMGATVMSATAVTACVGQPRQLSAAPGTIDGMTFLPEDLADLERAGLNAFICDVSDGEYATNRYGERIFARTFMACDAAMERALTRLREASTLAIAHDSAQLTQPGKAVAILQFQSAEAMGAELDRIGYFHAKGLRVLQITHNRDNEWGGGYLEARPSGLTSVGIEGLAELNRLRIVPDVSHASEETAMEVARRSATAVIVSHGACRAIVDNPRCASDRVIRAVAEKGGVLGVFMMSMFLTNAEVPAPDHYVAHIRHLVNVGGIDVAGIANDYAVDGRADVTALGNGEAAKAYHSWFESSHARGIAGFERLPRHAAIPEFNSIHRTEAIRRALERSRFRSGEIEKIMGGNFARVLREVLS